MQVDQFARAVTNFGHKMEAWDRQMGEANRKIGEALRRHTAVTACSDRCSWNPKSVYPTEDWTRPRINRLAAKYHCLREAAARRKNNSCLVGINFLVNSNGVGWVTFNDEGGRLVSNIKNNCRTHSLTILDNGAIVDGVRVNTNVPSFLARVEHQKNGKRCLVLDLDTARFKENEVKIKINKSRILVLIEHSEKLPFGHDVTERYDIPYQLPETDANNAGVVSYFSDDGKLTIESSIASTFKF